jgi:hypothetical protein
MTARYTPIAKNYQLSVLEITDSIGKSTAQNFFAAARNSDKGG